MMNSENQSVRIRVADIELAAPPESIYTYPSLPSSYDYGPWMYIFQKLAYLGGQPGLIDIGANVGDSVAHFRRFSQAKAIAVEASDFFASYLQENLPVLGDTLMLSALAVPKRLIQDGSPQYYKFQSSSRTGSTEATSNKDESFAGNLVSIDELLDLAPNPSIFKSDTDGFDHILLDAIVSSLSARPEASVPVIFVEGPSLDQIANNQQVVQEYFNSFQRLAEMGYHGTLFANVGTLFCECGTSVEAMASCFSGLRESFSVGHAYCHYFDIIFYRPS